MGSINNDMENFREFFTNSDGYYSDHELINFYTNNPKVKIRELSQMTGRSIGEIYRILHNYNVSPNRLNTNHHNVVNFSNFGFGVPQIAELTGYTPRNVRYILSKIKTEKNNG